MILPVPEGTILGLESFDMGADRFVAVEGDRIVGRIAVSYLETPRGQEAIVHDLWADAGAPALTAARLVQAARGALRARGLACYVFTVLAENSYMMEHCLKAGMRAEAVTFRAQV